MESHRIVELASIFKGDVSAGALEAWLKQFADDDIPYIIPLLEAFKYYSLEDVFSLLDGLFQKLRLEHSVDPLRTWFIPSGYVAKSGDAVAYFFKRRNRIPDDAFLRGADLNEQRLTDRPTVVFLDDFVGSGQLLLRTATEIAGPLKERRGDARFIFAALIGYVRGIQRLGASASLQVCVAELVGEDLEPFGDQSRIFPDKSVRLKAEAAIRRYTERLSPRSPLGYGGSQGLIAFFFGTPNNTLPIFWRSSPSWQPLLPHGDALHDPRRVIDIPSGIAPAGVGASSIEELDVSKDATADLFNEFQTLRNMEVAGRLMKRVGLTDAGIHALVGAIQLLEEDVHEKKPVCTAILCATVEKLPRLLTNAFLLFDPPISLNDAQLLRTAAQLVDGLEATLLFDQRGQVHGAITYSGSSRDPVDPFLPARYVSAAAAARDAEGFVVLFTGSGRLTILDRGIRVLTRRFGKWHPQGVPTGLRAIEAEHGLNLGLLDQVLKAAFSLADSGSGALFTVGDSARVASLAGKVQPTAFRWREISIAMQMSPFLFAARKDGATVLDERGMLRTTMTILQPPAQAVADDEAGKGARHTTAAKVSAVSAALTIAVSEDGTITLYSQRQWERQWGSGLLILKFDHQVLLAIASSWSVTGVLRVFSKISVS